MNKLDIKKLDEPDGLVSPLRKDVIKRRKLEEEQRQQKLRQKYHNKLV